MPGIIALFGSGSDAEKVYRDFGENFAGGYSLIRGIPGGRSPESNRKGLTASMAGDLVVDSATVGLFTENPGDHVLSDPWDEEFGLEYSPGPPVHEDAPQPMVSVRGDFPGLADGGVERMDRVVARIPVTAEQKENISTALREGQAAIWARVDPDEMGRVRATLEQAGPESLIETNG